MIRRLALRGLAVAVVLALLAWRVPAAWGLAVLHWSHPELAWSGSEGTVWRGAVLDLRRQGLHLGRVEWRFRGMDSWRSLRGRWELTGQSPQYRLSGVLAPAVNGTLRIEDLHGDLPAAWIDISPLAPLTYPAGRLQVSLPLLRLSQGRPVYARGRIHWMQARLTGLVQARLGSIWLQLRPVSESPGGAIRVELLAQGPADVLVQGNGLILGQRFELTLDLSVAAERPRLRELLLPFGKPRENGTIAIHLQGSLPP